MPQRVAVSLGKTLNAVSHLGAKQSIRCSGPAWRKTCKQSSFCAGVVWQTQCIVKHLVLTNEIQKTSVLPLQDTQAETIISKNFSWFRTSVVELWESDISFNWGSYEKGCLVNSNVFVSSNITQSKIQSPIGSSPSFHGCDVSPSKVLLGYLGPLQPCSSKLPVVPCSRCLPGNELADSLAKTGATLLFAHLLSPLTPVNSKIRHTRYTDWRQNLSHNSFFCQISSVS